MIVDASEPVVQKIESNAVGSSSKTSKKTRYLLISIIVDLLGMMPFLDEILSIPSAILVYWMYGSWVFAVFDFLEEISFVGDWIPTATICWIWIYWVKKKE